MAIELRKTKTVDETWVGGCFPMPAFVMEDGPFRPLMALWLDVTNDVVVGSKLLEPEEHQGVLVDVFHDATQRPLGSAGAPRRPAKIRIADAKLAQKFNQRFGEEVSVEIAPTPELDAFMQEMAASMSNAESDAYESYLDDNRLSADTMARFFTAAAKLWELAPWKSMYDAQLLQLDCPSLQASDKVVSIIGNLGESFGALVFDSLDGYLAMGRQEKPRDEEDLGNIGTSLMAINFDRGADIPKKMRTEVAKYGWVVADANAYPSIQRRDPDLVCRPLTDDDVVLATVYTEALTAFFTKHIDAITTATFISAHEHVKVQMPRSTVAIDVVAPHPQMLWESVAMDDSDDEEHPGFAESHAIIDSFLRHETKAGRSQDWLDAAEIICENLYEFKLWCADGKVWGWSATLVKAYLLDHLPHSVVLDDNIVECLPDVIKVFFAWAQTQQHVGSRSGNAIVKCIEQNRRQFFREMADTNNFSMAKALMKRLEDDGVDLADQNAVAKYMEKIQETGLQ